jgi:hypothetical protein
MNGHKNSVTPIGKSFNGQTIVDVWRAPPKAEVTGLDSVWCTDDFNVLKAILHYQKGACPQNVRVFRSRVVPGCAGSVLSVHRRVLSMHPCCVQKRNFCGSKLAKATSEQFLKSQQYGRTSKAGSLKCRT